MANPFGPKVTDALLWVAMPVGSPERRKRFYELCDKWGDKVFYSALERLDRRGYVEYGVNIRGSWLTDKGKEALAKIVSHTLNVYDQERIRIVEDLRLVGIEIED